MKVLRVLRRQKGGSDFGERELEVGADRDDATGEGKGIYVL